MQGLPLVRAANRFESGPDRRIAWVASGQHGLVTHAQLEALGIGPNAIEWRVRQGRLHRVHRGVYLVGHTAASPFAPEMAGALACGPDAAVSHHSAGGLWHLLRERPQRVEMTMPGTWKRRHPGLRTHCSMTLMPVDRRRIHGIPLTSPARTILDLAASLDPPVLEGVVAEAERRHLTHPSDLVEQLDRNPRRRGSAALRSVLGLEGGPAFTRSDAEARLLALVRETGLPVPVSNAIVAGCEVDLFWREARLIVEFDSFAFHGDRRAFEQDRLRDAELQAAGFRVIRVTWRQLVDQPEAVVNRISRAIAVSRDERAITPGIQG
jgi:very-short-patch-repair endonuclease